MLNLKVNIEQDNELRNYIKDCIKGQVYSIARREIKEIISESLSKKYDENLLRLIKDEIQKIIKQELKLRYSGDNYIKQETRKILDKLIKEGLLAQNSL